MTLLSVFVLAALASEGLSTDCTITDYGAVPDNTTVNTQAIQRAIDSCHAASPVLGSRVVVPAGAFKTGSISLRSNMELHLEKGAGLYGSESWDEYPVVPGLPFGTMFRALISGYNLSNVKVTGSNDAVPGSDSIIDGVGWSWWCIAKHAVIPPAYCGAFNQTGQTLPHGRLIPKLVEFFNCTHVTISDFTAQNSPFWTITPTFSSNVKVQRMTVLNPRHVGQTDGVDPDSCVNCLVEDCYIDVGDDGISIKAYNVQGFGPAPSRDVTVRRTKVLSRNVCLGAETQGGVSNVLFEDVMVGDPDQVSSPWAIKFKIHAGDLRNITFRRMALGKIGDTPWMYPSAPGQAFYLDIKEDEHSTVPPTLDGLTFEDIHIVSVKSIGHIRGPASCVKNLRLHNVTVGDAGNGWGACSNIDPSTFVAHEVSPALTCSACNVGLAQLV